MKGMTLTGKFVMVDGVRYFRDEIVGLVKVEHFSSPKRDESEVEHLESPVEYKGILTINDAESL